MFTVTVKPSRWNSWLWTVNTAAAATVPVSRLRPVAAIDFTHVRVLKKVG